MHDIVRVYSRWYMTSYVKLCLLGLVYVTCVGARAGGALGPPRPSPSAACSSRSAAPTRARSGTPRPRACSSTSARSAATTSRSRGAWPHAPSTAASWVYLYAHPVRVYSRVNRGGPMGGVILAETPVLAGTAGDNCTAGGP